MQAIVMTPRVRMEREVARAKAAYWPNMPRKAGQRKDAPKAFQDAVNHASHMDPAIESMVDQAAAHDIRQQIRDDLFAYARSI